MSDQLGSVVSLLSGGLRTGESHSSGPLTLVSLFGGTPAPAYVLAADAFEAGFLTISELGEGSVPQLMADNKGDFPVLLLDGEHLEGAKQHRVLNVTVLLAPRHRTVIPVTCVEQGRWHYAERSDFASSPIAANPGLRAMNKAAVAASARKGVGRQADQRSAWAYVEATKTAMRAGPSPTGALRDYYEERRGDLEVMINGFPGPEEGQTGVAACVAGKILAVDAFDRPETLAKLWRRLISGYAADAIGRPEIAPEPGAVDRFLFQSGEGKLHLTRASAWGWTSSSPRRLRWAPRWSGKGRSSTLRSSPAQRTVPAPVRSLLLATARDSAVISTIVKAAWETTQTMSARILGVMLAMCA